MDLATSVLVPLGVSLGGALLGAPAVESLRNRHKRREVRNLNRQAKIVQWRTWIGWLETHNIDDLGFRDGSESYLSLKKYLKRSVIKSMDSLVPGIKWPDPISDEEYLNHRGRYFEVVNQLRAEIVRLEKKWWLL